ncbi:hypothetical protein FACS1894164_11030 [Spirochaetia bacterium]|nr:hypothetical protein FACS1894164_11030 [Spirochaetia bacterium]
MPDFLTKVVGMFDQEPDLKKMGFLSTFFRTTPDSFTDAEYAEYDILRSGAEISPVVRNLNTGAVTLVGEEFSTKGISFPVYALEMPAQIQTLMQRQPGETAYVTAKINWLGRLSKVLVRGFARMTNMIRRSIELQAAQILQTGTVTLTDEDGKAAYELNFKPKATHFPVVAKSWSDATADPLKDLGELALILQTDGLVDITTVIMGRSAWNNFIKNAWVQAHLNKEVMALGALNPQLKDKGAKYLGYIDFDAYRFEFWMYNATYEPFGSQEPVPYLDPDKVLLLPDTESLDFQRFFGGIPSVLPDETFDQIFGAKITIGNEYDFRPRVYADTHRETWIGEIKSRPLLVPKSIDRWGCLMTVAAQSGGGATGGGQ